ncbi:hypothetical protein AB0N93_37980 [Streptomyces sp. NPDC091267]|uniref:hypothetical protein n=1 Tax=Streptomyces sp. NPDC091267 TaxID=3155195 RepID=UPI0034343886
MPREPPRNRPAKTTTGKRHLQRIREQRDSVLHQGINNMPTVERRALAIGLAGLQTQLSAADDQEHHRPVADFVA